MRISADGLNTFVLHLYFSVSLSGTWAGPSRRILSSAPLLGATVSVLCIFVSLPHFAPKSDDQVNTLGEGASSTAQWRSFSTGMNKNIFHLTSTAESGFCKSSWFSADYFLPPVGFPSSHLLIFPCPYSKKAFKLSHLELQAWRREHYHLQRAGGRAAGSAHGLSPSLSARAVIQTFTFAVHSSAPGGLYLFPSCTTSLLVSMFKCTTRHNLGKFIFFLNPVGSFLFVWGFLFADL